MGSSSHRCQPGNTQVSYQSTLSTTHRLKTRKSTTGSKSRHVPLFQSLSFSDKPIVQPISYILVLVRKKFKLEKEDYESIINLGPETAQSFLFKLYEFLTGYKLNTDRRLTSTLTPSQQPMYKKPTASYVAKDRELQRVVDNNEKEFRTKTMMEKHLNNIHTQKYNTGLIEWLIDKRKDEIQKEVEKQKEQLERKTKSIANNESHVEVREIELKCFNSSTSKKNKGEYGDFVENKGVLEFLTESCSLLFKRESIANDLKKLGIEIKEKQQTNLNIIEDIFKRCQEEDSKGNKKLSQETLTRILQQFKKTSEMNLIIDNINSNFLDFKKFFSLFLKPLKIFHKESDIFRLVVNVISLVAKGLHRYNSQNAQMLFQELMLHEFLKVGENEYKKPVISTMCLQFVRAESDCYLSMIMKVKEIYSGNIKMYVSYLPYFLEKISHNCEQLQRNLWSQFLYYGFLSLSRPSPIMRVNGAKIISRLFSDVVVVSNEIINEKLDTLKNLITDPWWEVRAQGLIIFKALLISKYKNESSSEDINQDLNMKTVMHYIVQIFTKNISHNILRIGLIELAELLNYQPTLCRQYLQILLHVGPQIRGDVLSTAVIKFGPVVYGSNTFNYKLTGAPLMWNSVGIAKVLKEYISENNIEELGLSHLQILHSTISKGSKREDQATEWLQLYNEYREKVFKTLLNEELCSLGASIIKQFMAINSIHEDIITSSKSQLSLTLSNAYTTAGESKVKENLLDLFHHLKERESEYTYKILKEFAEKQKDKYLGSNLVEFMNDLSRERRKQLFNE